MNAPELNEAMRSVAAMLEADSSDARAGLGALLREIAASRPELVQAEAARLDLQRLGLPVR